MYRFRSVESLIGEHQELEKQQIYFAAADQLNDPLEGTRLYFWKGDGIVWRNLLKHYLLCLEHVILLARLSGDDKPIQKSDIPVNLSLGSLPTPHYRDRIREIYELFFRDSSVQSFLQFVSNKPKKIYRDEMYVHLKLLSPVALQSIWEVDQRNGLIQAEENIASYMTHVTSVRGELYQHPEWTTEFSELVPYLYDVLKSWDHTLLITFKDSPKIQGIMVEFPQLYLGTVVELTYPKAYIACFMDNCTNSSIWGTYGNEHKGVCLKFRTGDAEHPSLSLKRQTGFGSAGYTYDFRESLLQPMNYSSEFQELDFFRNLGWLPVPQLEEQWYSDDNRNLSVCSEDILQHQDEWRQNYWNVYEQAYLTKLPDWSSEREYRILLTNSLNIFEDPKNRTLEYRFEDLEAIIFGMKTPMKDRATIIDIVKQKCEETGRTRFDFYEMAYSERRREWYMRVLSPVQTHNNG